MRKLAIAALSFVAVFFSTAQAEEFIEGKHYELLDKPYKVVMAPGKEGVVHEYFSYSCGHCFKLEPFLEAWKKDIPDYVQYEPVPAVWAARMETEAKVYYAARAMGKLDQIHPLVFDTIHVKRKRLNSLKAYAEAVSVLGIDKDKFEGVANSFAVVGQVAQAGSMTMAARIPGTPAIIVNGKYRVTGTSAGSNAGMLKVADYLIEMDRKAK